MVLSPPLSKLPMGCVMMSMSLLLDPNNPLEYGIPDTSSDYPHKTHSLKTRDALTDTSSIHPVASASQIVQFIIDILRDSNPEDWLSI